MKSPVPSALEFHPKGRYPSLVKKEYPLSNGYSYSLKKRIRYDELHSYYKNLGYAESYIQHLCIPNPSGRCPSIAPDGGMIVATRSIDGTSIELIPLLSSEAKHQESGQGNAIERFFKNYNAIKSMYEVYDIFPYIGFFQGGGLMSSFEQNKLVIGMGNGVNRNIDIHDTYFTINGTNKLIQHKNGIIKIKQEMWEIGEMYDILIEGFRQSYAYFKNEQKKI